MRGCVGVVVVVEEDEEGCLLTTEAGFRSTGWRRRRLRPVGGRKGWSQHVAIDRSCGASV